MEELGERPGWSMSGSEMLSTLDVLDAELARLQTYRLHLIACLENIGYSEEIGAHDTARLLAFRYRLSGVDARRDVRLAIALPKYDAVSAALPEVTSPDPQGVVDPAVDDDERWSLRPAQAEAIVSALERVPATVPVEDIEVAEQQLVSLARHLSPAELRQAGKGIRDLLDADGPEPDEQRAYARESLTMSNVDNGVKFRGYLANENAELLRALIHANARPHKTLDGEHDPRSRDKRQADALTTALTIAATVAETGHCSGPAGTVGSAAADAPAGPGMPASPGIPGDTGVDDSRVAVGGDGRAEVRGGATIDQADNAAGSAAASSGAGGSGAVGYGAGRWVTGFGAKANITVTIDLNDLKAATADATGKLVYGDDLSAAAIRRLACDAKIIPLVLGSNSEPLDVGRSERLVNRAMRRALNARDRGCVVCGAPPVQCDAHHVQSWLDGGVTAVSNLVLLCRRHHVDLHAGHWSVSIVDGVVHVSRPSWADPPPPHDLKRSDPRPPIRPAPERSHLPAADPELASIPPDSANGCPDPSGKSAVSSRRPSRWVADEERLKQAARFAVWGNEPPHQPLAGRQSSLGGATAAGAAKTSAR